MSSKWASAFSASFFTTLAETQSVVYNPTMMFTGQSLGLGLVFNLSFFLSVNL